MTECPNPWILFRTIPPESPGDAVSLEFPKSGSRYLRLHSSGFETREEALLFAESHGLRPETLPFEPSLLHLRNTGEAVPFSPREEEETR